MSMLVCGNWSAHPGAAAAAGSGYFEANGYAVRNPAIWAYVQHYGGIFSLGQPISNEFLLLGNRVQLFQRHVVEVHPDGTVGQLDLISSAFLPIAATIGATSLADPALRGRLPLPGRQGYAERASQYLKETAPDWWDGSPVRFGATYRASLRCEDLAGSGPCDQARLLALAAELWGLPTSGPNPDPHNPDVVYLWLQHAGMVHVRSTGQTQWLLLGELFKQVLLGARLPDELSVQINRSPASARFYAQYDPSAPSGVARPRELPNTSLQGAFVEIPGGRQHGTATPVPSSPPASPPPKQPSAPPVGVGEERAATALDARFGVAEGFRNPDVMADVRAGWERIVLPWNDIQPSRADDLSRLGATFPPELLRAELARGRKIAAVLQSTPRWAQRYPLQDIRSVPVNLDLPFDDPRNFWGQFVYETVRHYAGRIDEWILWNEPDFRLGDSGDPAAVTWAGTDREFAQLLKVGYLAAKRANPHAVVSFPATSYWADEAKSRPPFYQRILDIWSADPAAAAADFYHDAVSLNLYRTPDDVFRVHALFKTMQSRYGLDKPIWLTEMNAMPVSEPGLSCPAPSPSAPAATLEQQSSYVVQTAALAAAAGYQHIEFFQMQDGDACQGQSWGLTRRDRSQRPVVGALRTAVGAFSTFTRARFMPIARELERWTSWPGDPTSYTPNWRVYQVVFDKPGGERVRVLWNGDGVERRVAVQKATARVQLLDSQGREWPLADLGAWWEIILPPAPPDIEASDSTSYHTIGGEPLLLVEQNVGPAAPIATLRLII